MVIDVPVKNGEYSKPLFKSHEGPLERILVRTSKLCMKGQSFVSKKIVLSAKRFLSVPQQLFRGCWFLSDCRHWTYGTTHQLCGEFHNFGNPINHKDRQPTGRVQPLQYSGAISQRE